MITIPDVFKSYKQFICWTGNKIPTSPITGGTIDPTDPANWMTADEAIQYGYGVGFVFTKEDPFFFVDIDKCRTPTGWSPIAIQLCKEFTGCYIEVSQSGQGLHIFGSGNVPAHGCRNGQYGLELYTEGRYVALTGTSAVGDAAHRVDLTGFVTAYFPPSAESPVGEWTTGPCAEWSGIVDDDKLIKKMLKSKSTAAIFGGKSSIADLWNADPTVLGDHSIADAALVSHLAFWTGKDCARIDRLFRRSGLMRDKWDRKDGNFGTYGRRTILKGCAQCNKVFNSIPKLDPTGIFRDGFQYLNIERQVDYFKGCCYIQDIHSVFTPDGGILSPEQFKAMYGGYVFALDNIADKTTRNAWDAFSQSQGYYFPKAHSSCFRPECPSGSIIHEEERSMINTYIPINTVKTPGDITPFLRHCELVLPNPQDREILLSYMAACVQYPGIKFQWAPLLQGCEGNGKSLFTRCLGYAIGHRYTHVANANDLDSKFNGWIQNKLLIIIEEIYTSDKRDTAEIMKPYITNDRVEIQSKGVNQFIGDNRANFFMCSNYKNAVIKNANDRRYCVFFMAQQTKEDMAGCGFLTPQGEETNYFPRLYDWLRAGGYAIVANYLTTYKILEVLNPATNCNRAPTTSTTEEVLWISLGGIEQEVLEAIDEKRTGFANGWISSMAFDKMLKDNNKRITRHKRRDILLGMGYIPHPNLNKGRVNNLIPMDGGKPILYIKRGSILSNITQSNDIAKKYMADQQMAIMTAA